jgi:hypothetical protein
MTEGTIGETVHGFVDRIAEIRKDIATTEPIIRDELLRMDDDTFRRLVCRGIIGDKLEEVPEGTHLFQCTWNNRQLFNDRSRDKAYMAAHDGRHEFMIANDPGVPARRKEPHPEIMVNIARLSRFAMACPYGETEQCPRRNVQFEDEEDKRREATRLRETEVIR